MTGGSSLLSTFRNYLAEHHRRISRLLLILLLVAIGLQLFDAFPREVAIRYALGSDHARIHEVRIAYELGGEEVATTTLRFPHGAPSRIERTPKLAPGQYQVVVDLRGSQRLRTMRRDLTVPAEGLVYLDLADR